MIKAEELKQCKNVSDELIQVIKDRISELFSNSEHNHMEDDFGFEHEGVSYDVEICEESSWDDQGKYQYQDTTYQLVSFDKNITSYPCEANIIDKFNLFLNMSVQRSGSYFSEYYYTYDKPILQIVTIEHIPEKIVPAHDKVILVNR